MLEKTRAPATWINIASENSWDISKLSPDTRRLSIEGMSFVRHPLAKHTRKSRERGIFEILIPKALANLDVLSLQTLIGERKGA